MFDGSRMEFWIDRNVWGTDKTEINADEFCVECEQAVPHHYDTCPLYTRRAV